MRIAFMGTHGIGKTTASSILRDEMVRAGMKDIHVLPSATRSVLEWGELTPGSFELACIFERRRLMLTSPAQHIISERWAYDEYIYGNNIQQYGWTLLQEMKWELENYWDVVYFLPYVERNIEDDGIRPLDRDYQKKIADLMELNLIYLKDSNKLKVIPNNTLAEVSSYLKEEVEKWKS